MSMNVTEFGNESRKYDDSRGYLQMDSAEHEEYAGAPTDKRITEKDVTNADRNEGKLLERILNRNNLNQAFKQVKKNKGAHGVDGITVDELLTHLKDNGDELKQQILDGKYRPRPVRRVEIPKDNGKKRRLGIPTATDRVVQQAITQVLSPIFELQFCETSYGFRPKRSAHDALKKCLEYANDGYTYVVDMDLEKFFDTVNHTMLIEILGRTIKDGRVISLIHKYLNAGVMKQEGYGETKVGLVQGGNISPLLSNVMLNEVDQELKRRGIRYVRYADDMLLFAKSKRSAQRIMANILPFIEGKLKLKVNKDKTSVSYIGRIKFLGYGFYTSKDGMKLRVHQKSVGKMKDRIRQITSRSNGISYEKLKIKLKQYITGWVNYFKLADMKRILAQVDEWLRRRLRMYIWKRWKKIRTRYKMLKRLGYSHTNAIRYANTRKGYWHTASSPILCCSITNDRLTQAGYTFFLTAYKSVTA